MKEKVEKLVNNKKGITLVALVITIVILIILATISINAIFGENGLVGNAEDAKFRQEKAEAQERLELVLADAYTEKITTTEYTQEEFLNEHLEQFVYEKEPDAEIFNEEGIDYISLNGHIFILDRSVPKLGDYDGTEGNRPPAIRRIEVISKTDTSATIEVIAARTDGVEYRYSIKKQEEGDDAYSPPITKSENTNEFTGLEKEGTYTIYTAKVELIKDGEVVDEDTIEIMIGKLEAGIVRFEDGKWENGKASVKIVTDETGYTVQYQIVTGENEPNDGNWIDTTSGSTIEGLLYGQKVCGRLWNGIDESEPAYFIVNDNIKPIITKFEATETTWNSITVTVIASDEQSGLASSKTYKYYINGESAPRETSTNNSYIFTELTEETSYTLKVVVTDEAGNEETQTITVTTLYENKSVTVLKELDYVIYPSKKGDLNCRVLYDNTSEYGVQIITSDTVGPNITIGSSDFETAVVEYNNAIITLNNAAMSYNNDDYGTARSVGTDPSNPEAEAGYHITGFNCSYSGKIKDADNHYTIDNKQLSRLNIAGIPGKQYWMASRNVTANHQLSSFYLIHIGEFYDWSSASDQIVYMNWGNARRGESASYALRPVFILNSDIKIVGGKGTADKPYLLGL